MGDFRYHHDSRGNVTFVLDGGGNLAEKYSYDAFGRPKIMDWNGIERSETVIHNPFMFQGRELLPELGIYDYRHRMYQPELGRFLQTDSTGFDAGDMNLFRYCGDDPVDRSDPTGLVGTSASIWNRLAWLQGGSALFFAEFDKQRQGVNDLTISQMKTQLDGSKDTTTAIVSTRNGYEVTGAATEVKVPVGISTNSFVSASVVW